MKISWGYKIAGAYLAFVIGMLFLVFKASNEQYDLVVEDYYEQELKYQDVIDQKQNLASLGSKVEVEKGAGKLQVSFPIFFEGKNIDGELYLYNPSSAAKDLRQPFRVTGNKYGFELPPLQGMYDVKLSWKAGGKSYLHEQKIFF